MRIRVSSLIILATLVLFVAFSGNFGMELGTAIVIAIAAYLLRGVIAVVGDYVQPVFNQPSYVREKNAVIALLKVLIWPISV